VPLRDERDYSPRVVRELGVEVDGHVLRVAPLVDLLLVRSSGGGGVAGTATGSDGWCTSKEEAADTGRPPPPRPLPRAPLPPPAS
jgi:hypothetical protein